MCESVEELKIGAIRGGKVSITFRGTRTSVVKRDAQTLEVKGVCALSDAN